jgi:hypothetical protein
VLANSPEKRSETAAQPSLFHDATSLIRKPIRAHPNGRQPEQNTHTESMAIQSLCDGAASPRPSQNQRHAQGELVGIPAFVRLVAPSRAGHSRGSQLVIRIRKTPPTRG